MRQGGSSGTLNAPGCITNVLALFLSHNDVRWALIMALLMRLQTGGCESGFGQLSRVILTIENGHPAR